MEFIQVQFKNGGSFNGQAYSYINDTSKPTNLNGYVVVDSPYSGICLAKVVSKDQKIAGTKYIIDTVDMVAYTKRQQQLERAAELKKRLDSKLEKFNKNQAYAMLAASDESAAAMLRELQELSL